MQNKTAIGLGVAGMVFAQLIGAEVAALAHQVQVSGEVGGTAHIEPNDNPRAGVPSQAWFAITRQGGELIPLEACNCQLSVYTQPYRSGDAPVQQPVLKPVSAEGYEGVPGAEITFPQVGAYELVLQGEPQTPNAFQPFELRFDVTVAAGQTAAPAPASPDAPNATDASPIATAPETDAATDRATWLIWAVPLAILAIGLPLLLTRARKK
jgi:hypothetical protein